MSVADKTLAPFRNIFYFIGRITDAVYYFFESLVNPSSGRYSQGRLINNDRSSGGANIHTFRPRGSGGNAPNMSIGGCRSCQM